MSLPLVCFEHVTVRDRDRVLLPDLSLRLDAGQHLALTGPSGAGKSALLAALAGVLPATGGRAAWPQLAAEARALPPTPAGVAASWQRLVCLVGPRAPFRARPGQSELYYQQRYDATAAQQVPTVREHLAAQPVAPPSAGPPAWELPAVVALLRLEALLDQPLIQLSNGETKRLRLATALLRQPRLLLLDNPLVGLDAASRAGFDELLAAVAARGTTLVLATAPAEVPALAIHVAELAAGRLVALGPRAAYQPAAPPPPPLPDLAALRALWQPTAAPADPLLQLENVTVRYGERLVLDNLNWAVRPGERWALRGPNGSGKSTLLSLLNGDNPQAYAQRIWLFGRRRGTGESIWDVKRQLGFASPELLQYFPGAPTCLQVVASGLTDTLALGRPTAAQLTLAQRWLAVLHLADYAATPLRQAPASVQRLCLVARALSKCPALLLLDEPAQGLDAGQLAYFRAVLDAICQATDVALVYVSHLPDEFPASVTRELQLGY
ncbi:ATP-binding cassette domain-containing protein [Hymenobacter sp. RP-2-7]|uniref:ATP-binding cassette domain-containing protein n=1 Tax=Hymenobacter polaris TaxID=2682546 RepID=A0A7Y0FKX8_9BACT|nr:ATP-binding cassette domain-containing protein [Hymenobacter polaris]NML64183.1 ATP-binding cassette domain-containing protein [Hymenobacter polaris]